MGRKETERSEAISLRKDGWSVPRIAEKLGVSKSSVSLWVREVPVPEKFTPEFRRKKKEERLSRLVEEREARRKRRILSGEGRWMIRAPEGYEGKTYIGGRYVYEHRYLMEQSLGRLLLPGEVVHHKDGDKLNNALENLELKNHRVHSSTHARSSEFWDLVCDFCGCSFKRRARDVRVRKKKGQKYFYCGRSCMAKHFGKGRLKNTGV